MPETNDPEYYRARAEKARSMAEAASDPGIKAIHARMAADYELLATKAAAQRRPFVRT